MEIEDVSEEYEAIFQTLMKIFILVAGVAGVYLVAQIIRWIVR